MNTRVVHKTSAIVIHSLDYGESDRIVTFYSSDFGKIKGIAKGARRSKKRFSNALEPSSYCNIIFSKKGRGTLALIEGCDVIDHHANIRVDLHKTLLSSYLMELIDKFTLEGKKNIDLFKLLLDFLGLINAGACSEALIRFFEIRLLRLAGYEPVLDRCMTCKKPVGKEVTYHFIIKDGGLRCSECHRNNTDSLYVSLGTIRTLLLGKEIDIARTNIITFSEQTAKESRDVLVGFIHHILGKEVKSFMVLNDIQKMGILSSQ
ncbi:MAG TPA: DNA repair protein RecO [Syntrophales bacterium]|jgi:DNA repair protein RecO (recombination protein O)